MKPVYLLQYLMLLLTSLTVFGASANSILNGDFELYEEPNVPYWQTINYVTIEEHFIPNPTSGRTDNWKIDPTVGLGPAQNSHMLVLSNGPRGINYAKAYQTITVEPNDTIKGFYFFGTCDYMDFNDFGMIYLADINAPIDSDVYPQTILAYADVNMVGDYGSMENWKRFEYTFTPEQAGQYVLHLHVRDIKDDIYESYLLVDGLALCHSNSQSDICTDCCVDLMDFSLLTGNWLMDCSDPNYSTDPNSNCYRGIDINGDGPVDINDLAILTEDWLTNCEP